MSPVDTGCNMFLMHFYDKIKTFVSKNNNKSFTKSGKLTNDTIFPSILPLFAI